MVEKNPPSEESIIYSLSTEYGIEIATLTRILLGADPNAIAYKAVAPNKTCYFVKIKKGHQEITLTLLAHLYDAGIEQVIAPVKTIQDKTTLQIGVFTLIVYPFIEGVDAFSRSLTQKQWVTLGKVLRQVHEFNVPSHIQERIRRENYSSKWREIVRSLHTHFSGDLKLANFMKKKSAEIHRLVDRAEQLAKLSREQDSQYVLCHSDIHGGNVLIDGKGAIYIVDWDDPIMAPKERDLMFIGGGVANVWNDPKEEEFFYKGYGKSEVNKINLAYYRHERIVEDIAIYGQELLLNMKSSYDRGQVYQWFTQMFDPRGVVDIAFETDENLK